MNSVTKIILISTIIGSPISQANVSLIVDDFSGSNIVSDNRFVSEDVDSGNWITRDSPWSISGGELVNSADLTDGNDERSVNLINTIESSDTSLTQITYTFDYAVGAGSTLFFHSNLFTGTFSAGTGSRLTAEGGNYFATGPDDFNAHYTSAFNLSNGNIPTGLASDAVASFEGSSSGTFTQTVDISAFTGINSIADVDAILAVFTADTSATGDGAISIDNFSITAVPEPSVFALFGIGFIGGSFYRRRDRG